MNDAIDNGYLEFRAMIYSGHPGCYWSGLLEEAHFWAIGHFISLDRSPLGEFLANTDQISSLVCCHSRV